MLSIQGKGYSKIYSDNPFHEDPQPKAFYHPTKEKTLSHTEKQLVLSPQRPESKKQEQNEELTAEKKFLSGSHAIKPLGSVQSHIPKSPDSSNFDESWPDSERPSSPSVATEERWGEDPLPYASIRKHAQPTFTSRPVSSTQSYEEAGKDLFSRSQAAAMPSSGVLEVSREKLSGAEHRPFLLGKDRGRVKAAGVSGKNGGSSDLAGKGSVLQRYIERFRHGTPMSREERLRLENNQKDEFWWLDSGLPTPNSTSTPKEEGGKSLPFTSQGQGSLTMENVRKRDDLDIATAQLQEKTDRVLHSVGSAASSGPVVSTEGLGSTGSDVTGSSFSEPVVRPTFLPREVGTYPRRGGQVGKGKADLATSHEDILYKWRLQRKLEAARQGPYIPVGGAPEQPPKTAAERETERRLAGFRENLLGRGSVVRTHLLQARVEKDMKQVQCTMDTGVQTSPARSPPSSSFFSHPTPTHPPFLSTDHKTSALYPDNHLPSHLHTHPSKPHTSSEYCDTQTPPSDGKQFASTADRDTYTCRSKDVELTSQVLSFHRDVQYRQFLEAEKPQDNGDEGTRSVSTHTAVPISAPPKNRMAVKTEQNDDLQPRSSKSIHHTYQEQPERSEQNEITHLHDAGDGSFVEIKLPDPADKIRGGKPRPDDGGDQSELAGRDVDSDSSSVCSQSRRKVGREHTSSAGKRTRKQHKGSSQEVSCPRQNSNQNNNAVSSSERSSNQDEDAFFREDQSRREGKVPQRRPPTDAAAQPRSGGERSDRLGVMPLPLSSSSPARTPLSSAIGQVVHDRLFDMSVSALSSVDSVSSLQGSVASPQLAAQHTLPASESDCESDREFESDPLLMVLRQQRNQYEIQLRLLDSILAERDVS